MQPSIFMSHRPEGYFINIEDFLLLFSKTKTNILTVIDLLLHTFSIILAIHGNLLTNFRVSILSKKNHRCIVYS